LPDWLIRKINAEWAVVIADDGVTVVRRDHDGRCYRRATGMNLRFAQYGKRVASRWQSDPRRHEIDLSGVTLGRARVFYMSDRGWQRHDNRRAREMSESLTTILFNVRSVLADMEGSAMPHQIDCARDANAIIASIVNGDANAGKSRAFIGTLYRWSEQAVAQIDRQQQQERLS
jgi:hypothetical protein